MNQQEQLAKEKAPVGGGHVCMTRARGSDTWDFAFATQYGADADEWWDKQLERARVWQVKPNGELIIRASK